jgi:hypothetical protein
LAVSNDFSDGIDGTRLTEENAFETQANVEPVLFIPLVPAGSNANDSDTSTILDACV